MKKWNLIFLILLMPGFCSVVNAGDVWKGGSLYSHFGLGLPYDFQSSYADGMGVYGVAIHNNTIPGMANPATWSRTVFTNISGNLEINSYEATIDTTTSHTTRFQAGPFQVVFPIKRNQIGLSLSISPLTSARYQSIGVPVDFENGLQYQVENVGNGGINRIETGIGIRLTPSFSIGYAPSLLFGVQEKKQTLSFHGENHNHQSVNFTGRTSHYGFGNRFGAYFSKQGTFQSNDRLSLGATLSLPVDFTSERSVKSRITSVKEAAISDEKNGNATFPLKASAGFSYHWNPFFITSADVIFEQWSEYKNFDGKRDQINDSDLFKDRFRAGMGAQYLAAYRSQPATFFSSFIYRMGVSYDTGSLRLNNTDIKTITLHTGLGIPSSRTNSTIDINASYGFRETGLSDLASERIFSLKISFTLSELMFIQRLLQ